MKKNPAAVALGRMGKGRKKVLTFEERMRRSECMRGLNARKGEDKQKGVKE